jgi:hypothetical protein
VVTEEGARVDMLRVRIGSADGLVQLWPELAPKTVEALRKSLPFESELRQCMWSGPACFTDIDAAPLTALQGIEMPVMSIYPKTLAIRTPIGPAKSAELLIAYGAAEYRWPNGRAFVTPIGELTGDSDACITALSRAVLTGPVPLRIEVGE